MILITFMFSEKLLSSLKVLIKHLKEQLLKLKKWKLNAP